MLIQSIYGIFCFVALFSALLVVFSPHPVYGALYLVTTMLSIAGLFVLMNAQLAAAFQVIVYAGAIMVLFMFVIMLLNLGRQDGPAVRTRGVRWWGLVFGGVFLAQVVAMVAQLVTRPVGAAAPSAAPSAAAAFASVRIHEVARLLMTDYVYAFEMTSVLLLIAIVGAVVLARRQLVQGVSEEDLRS
ncbi:MAG: NADH-quinone oxidoreductase subunit J [bacterium]|nr:NADH-quinone oxidoreductase subunit J [bacterium]